MKNKLITCALVLGVVMCLTVQAAMAEDPQYPPQWDAMTFAEVKAEMGRLDRQGLRSDCEQMAGYVAHRYPDVASVDATGLDEWLWLVFLAAPYQPDATRAAMAQDIVAQLVPDAAAIEQLSGERVVAAASALRRLGRKADACSVGTTWVASSDSFKSLPLHELAPLARMLAGDKAAGGDGRRKILDYLDQEILSDAGKTRSTSCRSWTVITYALRGDFSAEERTRWAEKLLAAFANTDEAVSALKGIDFAYVADALSSLSIASQRRLGQQWVEQHPGYTWPEATRDQMTRLAGVLRHSGQREAAAFLRANWISTSADNVEQAFQEANLTWRECVTVARAWQGHGDSAKAQEWAMRAYQMALAESPQSDGTLAVIGIALMEAGLAGEGTGDYVDYAAALVKVALSGKLTDAVRYEALCHPLNSPETRSIVEAQLVDPQGQPRVELANTLSWAHLRAKQLKQWQSSLEQRIGAAGGDAKARWLIARAYAESLETVRYGLSPLRGKHWLDEALATASSQTCRLEALRQLVEGYGFIGRHDAALALIAGVQDQFATPEGSSAIQTLLSETQQAKVDYIAAAKRQAEQAEAHNRKVHKAELNKRLATARARADKQEIRRYEALLSNLQ